MKALLDEAYGLLMLALLLVCVALGIALTLASLVDLALEAMTP